MTSSPGPKPRTYNSISQSTNITGESKQNVTYQNPPYTFPPAGQNAGKIASQTDSISGETVTYAYDSLKRLTLSNGSGWTQTYGYDGFGNLASRIGYGTAQSKTINTTAKAPTNPPTCLT